MQTENYLLPRYFRFIGFAMLVPLIGLSLYVFVMARMDDLLPSIFRSLGDNNPFPKWLETYFAVLQGFDGSVYDLLARMGWPLCLLFIAFSREKMEDEYIQQIRMRSLVWAFLVNGVLILLATLLLRRLNYVLFMASNIPIVLILYIVRFRITIFRLNRRAGYEE